MKNTKASFVLGFFLCLGMVVSCATTGVWPWPYYATSMDSKCYDNGKLLGPATGEWPDLALDVCKPDPEPTPGTPTPTPSPIRLKCMTIKADDFYAAKADDEKCHSDLIACQKACPSGIH